MRVVHVDLDWSAGGALLVLMGMIAGAELPLFLLALSAIAVICNQQWTKGR